MIIIISSNLNQLVYLYSVLVCDMYYKSWGQRGVMCMHNYCVCIASRGDNEAQCVHSTIVCIANHMSCEAWCVRTNVILGWYYLLDAITRYLCVDYPWTLNLNIQKLWTRLYVILYANLMFEHLWNCSSHGYDCNETTKTVIENEKP